MRRLVVVAAVAAVVTACGDGSVADGDEVVYLNPWNHDRVEVQQVEDSGPTVAPDHQEDFQRELAQYEELIDEFSRRADEVLQREDVDDVLGPFEQAFVSSGRYLELVELYQQHYEIHGVDSIAAPALAWSYVKIGHEPGAREMLDELREARPDDPETWVVVGKFHGRRADTSLESARTARDAYHRVLELDPDFQGFKMMDRQRLNNELEGLERVIERQEEVEAAGAGADQPMHHADDEAAAADDEVDDGETDDEGRAEAGADAEAIGEETDDRARRAVQEAATTPEEYVEEAMPGELDVEDVDEMREEVDEADEIAGADEEIEKADEDEEDETDADVEESADHLVARGRRAMQRGGQEHYRDAEDYFERALEADPDHVEAGIGLLRLAERTEAPREMLVDQLDSLAGADDLTARQAHELGVFALRSLNDRGRATSLLERVDELDPEFARRVGVDELLEDH